MVWRDGGLQGWRHPDLPGPRTSRAGPFTPCSSSRDRDRVVETRRDLFGDASHHFTGIDHEAICWYDPDALVLARGACAIWFLRRAEAGDANARLPARSSKVPVEHQERQWPTGVQLTKDNPDFIDYYGRKPWRRRTGRSGSKRAGRSPTTRSCRRMCWTCSNRK